MKCPDCQHDMQLVIVNGVETYDCDCIANLRADLADERERVAVMEKKNEEIHTAFTSELKAERAAHAQAKETHIMQLAAISTVSIQNTPNSMAEHITSDNPYWTVAYGDVCKAVEREVNERTRREQAEQRLAAAEAERVAINAECQSWSQLYSDEKRHKQAAEAELATLKANNRYQRGYSDGQREGCLGCPGEHLKQLAEDLNRKDIA